MTSSTFCPSLTAAPAESDAAASLATTLAAQILPNYHHQRHLSYPPPPPPPYPVIQNQSAVPIPAIVQCSTGDDNLLASNLSLVHSANCNSFIVGNNQPPLSAGGCDTLVASTDSTTNSHSSNNKNSNHNNTSPSSSSVALPTLNLCCSAYNNNNSNQISDTATDISSNCNDITYHSKVLIKNSNNTSSRRSSSASSEGSCSTHTNQSYTNNNNNSCNQEVKNLCPLNVHPLSVTIQQVPIVSAIAPGVVHYYTTELPPQQQQQQLHPSHHPLPHHHLHHHQFLQQQQQPHQAPVLQQIFTVNDHSPSSAVASVQLLNNLNQTTSLINAVNAGQVIATATTTTNSYFNFIDGGKEIMVRRILPPSQTLHHHHLQQRRPSSPSRCHDTTCTAFNSFTSPSASSSSSSSSSSNSYSMNCVGAGSCLKGLSPPPLASPSSFMMTVPPPSLLDVGNQQHYYYCLNAPRCNINQDYDMNNTSSCNINLKSSSYDGELTCIPPAETFICRPVLGNHCDRVDQAARDTFNDSFWCIRNSNGKVYLLYFYFTSFPHSPVAYSCRTLTLVSF